ncbi:MAG TPA: transglycosylase family protein [Solirubrobacterales bacterium]|nr:transglycosylase family protein [Solirubrobacterales bacterium]
MLTKRTHIVPALLLALAFPAVALASGAGEGSAPAGVGNAQPVAVPVLERPARSFHRLIEVQLHRMRAAARKQRREAFAELPGGVSMATLESIAGCESGGDPTAVSADGSYRGKYQFDYGTWESVGGHGDPAAAPEDEQDYRAALLYSRSGSSPWPICG